MLPRFSIVIPTYSRPDPLAKCLRSLSDLVYPRDRLEVLVVDDGGATPLDAVVAPFRSDLSLTLIRQPNGGPAAARNTGAQRAGGDYLAFTDDDCLADPDWLMELARVLSGVPEGMVGGAILNAVPSLYSETSQLIMDVVYRHYNTDPLWARFGPGAGPQSRERDQQEDPAQGVAADAPRGVAVVVSEGPRERREQQWREGQGDEAREDGQVLRGAVMTGLFRRAAQRGQSDQVELVVQPEGDRGQ
nr:glycosyltransferase family 2 protein [Gemmatimonadales bacterium]